MTRGKYIYEAVLIAFIVVQVVLWRKRERVSGVVRDAILFAMVTFIATWDIWTRGEWLSIVMPIAGAISLVVGYRRARQTRRGNP